jgi:outer membrane protein TolC
MKSKLLIIYIFTQLSYADTISEYYNEAVKKSQRIQESYYIVESTKHYIEKTDSNDAFNLFWNASATRNKDVSESDRLSNTYNEGYFKLTLQKILYNPQNALEQSKVRIEAQIEKLKYKKVLQDFTLEFIKKYFNVLRTKQNIVFSQKNERFAFRHYKKLQSLYEKNLVGELDYVKSKTNLQEANESLILSKLEFNKAKKDFEIIIDMELNSIKFRNNFKLFKLKDKVNSFIDNSNNIELKILELESKILQENLASKNMKFFPSVDFSLSHSKLDTQDPATENLSQTTGMINLTGILYKGGYDKAEEKEFVLLLKAQKSKENIKRQELNLSLNEEKFQFFRFLSQINILKKKLEEEKLNLKILNRKNIMGFTDNTKILESQALIYKLESQYTELSIKAIVSYSTVSFNVYKKSHNIIKDLELSTR